MKQFITAPCGIDCFNCEMYSENVTGEFQKRVSQTTKIPAEKIICKGCSGGNQCLFIELEGKKCQTLECVNSKGVEFCWQCDDFPCSFLMPLADGADRFPQNIKLYNLCQMKKLGMEAWKEQAAHNRKVYFTQKIRIGEGGS